jgi:Zn finger protein HypA/HybF involved in hydrogenase expression
MQKIPRLSSIIDHLLKQPRQTVTVNIAIGELAVYTENEIQTLWPALVQDTCLARTKLTIQHIPAQQQCMVCFQKYKPLNKETSCPDCGSAGVRILAGEEFYLVEEKDE